MYIDMRIHTHFHDVGVGGGKQTWRVWGAVSSDPSLHSSRQSVTLLHALFREIAETAGVGIC